MNQSNIQNFSSKGLLNGVILLGLFILITNCSPSAKGDFTTVTTNEELYQAIETAQAGDEIVMANGIWEDVEIIFEGHGTENRPITLKAETPGEVFIEGLSQLKFGGEYLVVDGLYFRNGFTPSRAVIEFRKDDKTLANHCRVTNTVIEDFNQMSRDQQDHWVVFWGRHNQLDHCYIAGKSNRGPTIRVEIKGNESINNYHQIVNNHFGPRPRKGGPSGETIQIGDSYTSMSPSHTYVAHNLFERCNGEVEVISSKTNFNVFKNNVFYKSEGSLVTRHGNYCRIDGNFFIGDENSDNIGGIRLINTGHWVVNNYFYNLKGSNFRSPLAVMNGIPKSPLNRYNQVTDVVVANNTWVNCVSPWQFGVGSNISQKDVLPLSEIRSARPIRTVVANNIIYNEVGDAKPIIAHDKIDGINFESNVIDNKGIAFEAPQGLEQASLEMEVSKEDVYIPLSGLAATELYNGFDFETIEEDIFGNPRTPNNQIGATVKAAPANLQFLDKKNYGATWYSNEVEAAEPQIHSVSIADDFIVKLSEAKAGDIIELAPGQLEISKSLVINKKIIIRSGDANDRSSILYNGSEQTPLFEMNPKGQLILENVSLEGTGTQFAFASLKENMSSLYNLTVSGASISNFDFVLKAYKETFADMITFINCQIADCENGIELSEETNDRGDYNVEFLTISDCKFNNIKRNVVDYYRGGYDESTIGGNLLITGSEFANCGAEESNGILLNTRGIINVDISNNKFTNNPVKLIALLWGAKNNSHADNEISNSGEIRVEENIKLNLMY